MPPEICYVQRVVFANGDPFINQQLSLPGWSRYKISFYANVSCVVYHAPPGKRVITIVVAQYSPDLAGGTGRTRHGRYLPITHDASKRDGPDYL
jgi:hypothetical protein